MEVLRIERDEDLRRALRNNRRKSGRMKFLPPDRWKEYDDEEDEESCDAPTKPQGLHLSLGGVRSCELGVVISGTRSLWSLQLKKRFNNSAVAITGNFARFTDALVTGCRHTLREFKWLPCSHPIGDIRLLGNALDNLPLLEYIAIEFTNTTSRGFVWTLATNLLLGGNHNALSTIYIIDRFLATAEQDEQMNAFFEALVNGTNLKSLKLQNRSSLAFAASHLDIAAKIIRSTRTTLRVLDLNFSQVNLVVLAEAFKDNASLTDLILYRRVIGKHNEEEVSAFHSALQINTTLTTLRVEPWIFVNGRLRSLDPWKMAQENQSIPDAECKFLLAEIIFLLALNKAGRAQLLKEEGRVASNREWVQAITNQPASVVYTFLSRNPSLVDQTMHTTV